MDAYPVQGLVKYYNPLLNMAGLIKILIADDHPAIRNGIKQILLNEFSDVELGEAANANEVFLNARNKPWDILILDINMPPGKNGLEVLKQLRDEEINVPVLIFSMHPEEQLAIRALKSGASGYLSKDAADAELLNAIHKILNGRKYISDTVAEKLATQIENPLNKAPHELLSDREFQTLLLIASGKKIAEIADQLSLSTPTVSTYRARILEKTGMKTNAELTNYVFRNNLL